MASNRGGGRGGGGGGRGSGGGGRGYGQENPNVAQGAYGGGGRGGGRGGQYPGGRGGGGGYESQYQHGGGRGDSQYQRGGYGGGGGGRGYQGGSDGGSRGGGSYQGGSDGGGGRGRGSYQGGSDGGGGRGRGSYQGSSDGGRGRGRGSYQGGNDGGRGRGRGGYHGPGRGQQHIAGPSREAASLDLPQAGPRLAERYAAEAARLRGQFKNLQIQTAEPKFPPRPGFGTKGQKCDVKANHFFVGFADRGLHQYDVSITPEVTLRSVYRAVMSKLVSEYQQSHLGGRLPAYDGRKCLYTAGPLPFTSRDFEIALSDDRDPHGPRRERNFRVTIKFATLVNLQQLQMLMAGYSTDIPAQALQVLDIVLRDVILNERNEMEYVAVGRSFFSPNIRSVRLGQGIMSWKGFYQSIRPTQMGLSLNIDMSSTAFIEPLPLVDFVQAILNRGIYERHISDVEYAKIKRALKGLRIEVTHRGNIRRKYRISSLTHQATSDLKFESSSGVTRTVKDYFRETYNLQIRYDFLPCLQVGSEQKLNYLPMEVCKIVPGQRYQKKLNEGQVSEMLKFTCQVPRDRERSIRAAVVNNEYNSANRATEFGIEVDNLPASVEARVLPAPTLKYHDSGAERECLPSYGAWNMRNKKVVNGARITNWACINFSQQVSDQDAQQFCFELAKMSRVTGLDLADLRLPIYLSRPDQIEGALRRHYQDMINRLRGRRLELLVAILPDNNGTLYGNLKRICETDIGIVSQCCLTKNVFKKSPQYFANVALKINAKVGGRNSVFADIRRSLPIVSNKPTIIFGADVTHPSPMEDLTPSIASVVASQDWPEVTKYNGLVRAQGHREELIRDLEEIVKELLLSFQRESRQRPQQLIFYRDGVSEGQFEQVLQKEIPEIEKAWKSLYNEKPPITFIVVQKRHHTRLFPNNYSDRSSMDRSGNVLPGTVVDCKICHPTEFDFYLCSHAGIQGTSRPTHYHVLRDDNKFSADDLQSLTNNLCYIYASCTRSVSIAPPAYYAHKLAFRARFYLDQDSDAGSMITGSTSAVRPLPSLKDNVKSVMFYC